MNLKERIEEKFWDYLHTVIFAHNNQPNEPHRQVIFKQEIPELISDILKAVELDEKKVAKILLREDCGMSWQGINDEEKEFWIAKAKTITQGDVWKEKGEKSE